MQTRPTAHCLARLRDAMTAMGFDIDTQEGLQEVAITVGVSAPSIKSLLSGHGDWNVFHELASRLKIELVHLFSDAPSLLTVYGYEGGAPIRVSCAEGLPVAVNQNLFWLRCNKKLSEQSGMPHGALLVGSRTPREMEPGKFYAAESPTSFALLRCVESEGRVGLLTDRSGKLKVSGAIDGDASQDPASRLQRYGVTGVLHYIVMPLSDG